MTTISPDRSRIAARMNPISAAVALAVGSITLTTSATAATTFSDEEMIVTSTRRDTSVQEVPFNMAAFSGDVIERQRLNNLNEIARWVPGLTFTDQGQRASSILTMRGLNASSIQAGEFLDNSGGDTVSTYVGEIPVFVDLKPYDMDRVEVLIGPQGTLYGAGTLAGAIRYIPTPPDLNNASVKTHVKTYIQQESEDLGFGGDVAFNIPIVSDVLAFRGLLAYVNEPGYIDYNYLVQKAGVSDPEPSTPGGFATNLRQKADVNDEQTFNARAALRWNVYEPLTMDLRYDYQNKQVGGRNINSLRAFDTTEYVSGLRFTEPNERENHIAEFSLRWDFGFAELTSASGYSRFKEDGQRDQTDLLLNFEYGYEDFPAFAAFTRDRNDETIITQEIRLVSQHDGPAKWLNINWLAGAYYSDLDRDAISEEFTPGIPGFFGLTPPPLATGDLEYLQLTKDSLQEIAGFGEFGLEFWDRWQVTVGARYYKYTTDTAVSVDLPLLTGGVLMRDFQTAKTDDNGFIGKLNTSVRLDDWIPGMSQGNLYATISQGYRIGGANLFAECASVPPPPGQNVCLTPGEKNYEPDKTINYELGLKSTWFDDMWLVNIAGFYVDWSDIQLDTISQFGNVPLTTNASEARSTGVELQSRLSLFDHFSVYGAYTYTNVELTKDAPNIIGVRNGLPEDAFNGDRLPATPEHQGSLNFNYNQQMGAELTLDVDYGFVVQSDVYTKTGLRGRGEALPGFAVHHFSTGISAEQWSLSLYIDNLFDKYAVTGVRNDRDFIDKRSDGNGLGANSFTLRRYYYNVIRPRTFGLNFTYDFNL